jgi:hypothetical protein
MGLSVPYTVLGGNYVGDFRFLKNKNNKERRTNYCEVIWLELQYGVPEIVPFPRERNYLSAAVSYPLATHVMNNFIEPWKRRHQINNGNNQS